MAPKKKTKSRSNQSRILYTQNNINKGKIKILGGEAIGGAGKAVGKAVAKPLSKKALKKLKEQRRLAAARKRAANRKLTPEETGKAPVKKVGPGRREYEAKLKELGIEIKKPPRKFMGEWRNF
jgi:hypothetical protein